MTYGFMLKDEPHRYVYCSDLRCREDAPLAVRLHTLRSFREHLEENEGVSSRAWSVNWTGITDLVKSRRTM